MSEKPQENHLAQFHVMYFNLGRVSYERQSGIYITHQVGRKEHNDTKSKERSELTKKVREELMTEQAEIVGSTAKLMPKGLPQRSGDFSDAATLLYHSPSSDLP